MNLSPNDIDRVEDAGMIDQHPVKLIRTKGGFWIAIGRKRGKILEETLAAGSHPAIVKYNLEKQYSEFKPTMMKSESMSDLIVEKHSHYLTDDFRKSGHDIFSIQQGPMVDFLITKYNIQIANMNANIDGKHLLIENLNIPKEMSKAMAGAAIEKAVSCKLGLKIKK